MRNKSSSGRLRWFLLLCLIPAALSCARQRIIETYQAPLSVKSPDYADLRYWAAHPHKKDFADSVPDPLNTAPVDSAADVFFMHPTTFTGKNKMHQVNADIDDEDLNAKTDETTILYQASVFNGSSRVFAPRYRQAYLQMYIEKDTTLAHGAFDLAYSDIKAAFEYYLKNYNNGRPIIIASHSQGTTHSKRLLKEFFDGTPLYSKLVCAYLVGIPVEKDCFEEIPACKDSLSTGCVVSWRTYRKGYLKQGVSEDDSSLIVTNPVSWTSDPVVLPREIHKGAVLYNFNSITYKPHSTRIAGNALWISKPKFRGGAFYFKKNYHIGDINLFYLNVREDVSRRIRLYTSKEAPIGKILL